MPAHLVKQLPGVSPPNKVSLLPLSLTATKQSVEIKTRDGTCAADFYGLSPDLKKCDFLL